MRFVRVVILDKACRPESDNSEQKARFKLFKQGACTTVSCEHTDRSGMVKCACAASARRKATQNAKATNRIW